MPKGRKKPWSNGKDPRTLRTCQECEEPFMSNGPNFCWKCRYEKYKKTRSKDGRCLRCELPAEPGLTRCAKHYFRETARNAHKRTKIKNWQSFAEYIEKLWVEQDGRSAVSGQKMELRDSSLDRIVPGSKGGLYEPGNVRWILRRENEMKGGMSDAEFFERIGAMAAFRIFGL